MSTHNGMDPELMERAKYMAHMQQRTMPPRCHPLSIMALVITLGMVFIGLTMTVISHWPGNSSIGENPLKKAGPSILGVGGGLFILFLVMVCLWQTQEREAWHKSMQQAAMSRSMVFNQSASQPQRSILKAPSVSTYGRGSEYGSEYGTGYNQGDWSQPNVSYGEPEMGGPTGHEVYRIDTVQDPTKGPVDQSSIDYGQHVPTPVRQTKPKLPKSSVGEMNKSYSPNGENGNERKMRSYSKEGYDMYETQGSGAPVPAERKKKKKRSEEGGESEGRSRRHHQKEKTHTNGAFESDGTSPKGAGYYSNVPGSSYYSDRDSQGNYPTVYDGAGLTSPMSGAGGMGLAGAGGMGLAGAGGLGMSGGMGGSGGLGMGGNEQQLKINIRAQPNTAVHITPSTYPTPPTQHQPYSHQPYNRDLNASRSSVETEI